MPIYFFFRWFRAVFDGYTIQHVDGELRDVCLGGDKGYYKIDPTKILGSHVLLTDSAVAAASADGWQFRDIQVASVDMFLYSLCLLRVSLIRGHCYRVKSQRVAATRSAANKRSFCVKTLTQSLTLDLLNTDV